MNSWEILGIEPTTDKKQIRLAYSVKLKAFHHEQEIMKFQQLRQAYEFALNFSGGMAPVVLNVPKAAEDKCVHESCDEPDDAEDPKDDADYDEEDDENNRGNENAVYPNGFIADDRLLANAFLERCYALYQADYRTRYAGREWLALAADEKYARLRYNKQLSWNVFRFVVENADFSPGVASTLNSFFGWTQNEAYWASRVPSKNFDIFLLKVKKGLFALDRFDFDARIDLTAYFNLRKKLYEEHLAYTKVRSRDNFRNLRQTLGALRKIYAKDKGLSVLRKYAVYHSMAWLTGLLKEKKKKIDTTSEALRIIGAIFGVSCSAVILALCLPLLFVAFLCGMLYPVLKRVLKGKVTKYNKICALY